MFRNVILAALAVSSVVAHSNMFSPKPRENKDSEYTDSGQNACGFEGTDIPQENNFKRGDKVPVNCECLRFSRARHAIGIDAFCHTGWWNNHDGGFIKMALIKDMKDNVSAKDQELFLRNENSPYSSPCKSPSSINHVAV